MGISSAAIGILAFFLTRCESDAPSLGEWRAKADAICEQEFPGVIQKMQASDAAFLELLRKPEPTQVDRNTASEAAQEVSVSMRHLVGSWRALEQPDERRGEIDALHTAGADFSEAYASFSSAIYSDEYMDEVYGEQEEAALTALTHQIEVLDLKECKVQVGGPEDEGEIIVP
ncbi:hypothetical protein [Streptomyces venezuelae]|uniref:hypothetical protein n=1 Tax=Streptomyces venezuelae TaxID=54571 RepID=UPI0005A001AB|nr:hypothetical protein [Streptomyces venezuelae]APE23484.1 hypothetical protein vnz_22335 [Streptomyces venezuelae]QES00856.1 hypothetical protein DEJ43_22665 [Streptomyces venezuelae ATCC 10712]